MNVHEIKTILSVVFFSPNENLIVYHGHVQAVLSTYEYPASTEISKLNKTAIPMKISTFEECERGLISEKFNSTESWPGEFKAWATLDLNIIWGYFLSSSLFYSMFYRLILALALLLETESKRAQVGLVSYRPD